MKDRLLNPKQLGLDLESLPIITINNEQFRHFTKKYTHINDGKCQCFKDCDCAKNKGKITITKITWYRNIKFDGTDKCFYSIPYTQKEY
ncbi:MAG: hypothetical protein KC414_14420 [Romboutsia sp.]|nr:hypothetical protein [Romboutsia sp.]